jgi:hypothetical protein
LYHVGIKFKPDRKMDSNLPGAHFFHTNYSDPNLNLPDLNSH